MPKICQKLRWLSLVLMLNVEDAIAQMGMRMPPPDYDEGTFNNPTDFWLAFAIALVIFIGPTLISKDRFESGHQLIYWKWVITSMIISSALLSITRSLGITLTGVIVTLILSFAFSRKSWFRPSKKRDSNDLKVGLAASEQGDEITAFFKLESAAENGDSNAQTLVGMMFYEGKGVEKDYNEAVRWYMLAANQGNATAQDNLGVCYYKGEGVQQDLEEAVRWFKLAAHQGLASAQYNLGVSYIGGEGFTIDLKEAAHWFRLAAEQNHPKAQHKLGFLYRYGFGLEEDVKEAIRLFQLAADQGEFESQHSLAEMYRMGEGVEQNYHKAFHRYFLAAIEGFP